MRVDLRRSHIGVAELLLHRSNVHATLNEMCRERMPERVTAYGFFDARLACSATNCPLHRRFIDVVAPYGSGTRIPAGAACGKHVLPTPCPCRSGILALKRVWQEDGSRIVQEIALEHRASACEMTPERDMQFIGMDMK